jgi:hypothetical protein
MMSDLDGVGIGDLMTIEECASEIGRLLAENAKLREALTRLRNRSWKMAVMDNGWVEDVTTAALEALLDRKLVYQSEDEIPVDRAGRKMYNKFGDKLDIGER